MTFMQRERMKDLFWWARVVVRTSNMNISLRRLADYLKKLHQKACRTCSMIIFLYSTNHIIDLWRCRCHCHRLFLNSSEHFETWGLTTVGSQAHAYLNVTSPKWSALLIRELKHATFLSHARQPEVCCFPI